MRTLRFTILILSIAICGGCRPLSSPWVGTPYEPPQPVQNPGQAMFAPTPETPTLRFATAGDAASQDAEIERYLQERAKAGAGSGSK